MISELLQRDIDTVVAVGGAGRRTVAHLRDDIARLAAALPEATEHSRALLVFRGDRYAFLASLLAAWSRGHIVALPPNTARDTIAALSEDPTVEVLHDLDSAYGIDVRTLLGNEAPGDPPLPPLTAPRDSVIATLFTSGSTGPMSRCDKTAAQIIGEAQMLASTFPYEPGGVVVPTVSPGHIYGLLFGVLAPLIAGAPFVRETPMHGTEIVDLVDKHTATILVSVPIHLRALTVADAGSMPTLNCVFSSAAPLRPEVAAEFASRHRSPIEILGSTETGGIAFREQSRGPDWKPLPGVAIRIHGDTLHVRSPWAATPKSEWTVTADRARAATDGAFTHLGRSDGVVKVAGRRVHLADIESRLLAVDGVSDGAVLAIPTAGDRGHLLLAAVSGLDEDSVRDALREQLDDASMPRRIRSFETLPREANGKLQRSEALRMFGLDPNGRALEWDFKWHDAEPDRDKNELAAFTVDVPGNSAWFDGHFVGYPVMAGAVQLTCLLRPALTRADLGDREITRLERVRFTGRILPGDTLSVTLEAPAPAGSQIDNTDTSAARATQCVDLRIRNNAGLCSSARVHFGELA